MKSITLPLLITVLLCAAMQSNAQKKSVATANVPSWVSATPILYRNDYLEKQAEDGYLNLAFIKQVNLPEEVVYICTANKMINEQGIENNAEISVSYDPSYQKLTFHYIHIIRGNQTIDKLKKASFRLLQQENDAYMHLYNGSITALLVLDDVRTGDVVEYAYSIKGFNPVYKGRYSDFYTTAYSVPVARLFYRLITDVSKPVYIENLNHNIAPVVSKTGNIETYEWSLNNIQAIHTDDDLPTWYDAFPVIMVSQYNDWLNIRQWAAELYPNNVTVQGGLQKKIDAIVQNNATSELRAAAALRLVQDEIRYLGIEMGTGTHKPANPNKTFTQRYGDCKDKAYLLVTMLKAMNIDATPVLVNTISKQTIARWVPSPNAFNHVAVRLTIEGTQYYVDPTATNQRGTLASIYFPAYGKGLVLADSTSGLTPISVRPVGKVNLKETFSAPDTQGRAIFTVVTESTGGFADDARYEFKNNSTFELQKKYKQFYSTYFEKIKADSITYYDDERTGAFKVFEYYTIENLWSVEEGIMKCDFSAFVINSYLKRPKDKLRSMPMAMYYPANYREEVEVELPQNWSFRDFDKQINNSVFNYSCTSKLEGRTLNMVFEFETLKDNVDPLEIDQLLADYKKVDDGMGWQLSYNTKAGTGASVKDKATSSLSAEAKKNIYMRLVVFFALLGGMITFFVFRHKRRLQSDKL